MKTLGIVGLGSIFLCVLVGCSAERSVDDEIGGGDPPGSQTGDTPDHQTKLNLPLLDLGGGIAIRNNGVIGSMTPGSWDGTGGMPTLPGGSLPGGDTPSGDGTGTSGGDGSGTPTGNGTGTGDTTGTPTGDTTGTSTGGTDIPVTTDTPPPVIDVPVPTGPKEVDGNPTCSDAFKDIPVYSLKIERLKDGTYSDTAFSVDVTFSGSTLDYQNASGATLVGVIVKGGPHAEVYTTSALSGAGLSTPDGEEISHVDFCYRD